MKATDVYTTDGITLWNQQPNFVSPRAKTRADTLRSELDTVRELDGVLAAIIRARMNCPKVFEEFKADILMVINDDLNSFLAKPPPPAQAPGPVPAEPVEAETGAEKLVAFFRARNNAPASIEEMANAIQLSRITVKAIIYKRHAELFERIKQRGKNNKAFFRLKETRET
jgi:hypothetical protein